MRLKSIIQIVDDVRVFH